MALGSGLHFVSEKPNHVHTLSRMGRKWVVFALSYNHEKNVCLQAKCAAGGAAPRCCWGFGRGSTSTSGADHDV